MKTLHIDTGREMRGGQWQALRLLRGLHARGDQPALMARENSPLAQRAREEAIAVRELSVLALPQMAREVQIVHAHDARGHTMAAAFPRAPIVVARRVAFPLKTGLLSRRKYARAAHYIAVSHHVAELLVQGGVSERKITVIYDGVPMLPVANGQKIVAPASNDPQKGLAIAREAAGFLGLELTLSSDLERDLAEAAMFVYLTHSEGLGSGVLLAMSAGVPVIASDVGGLREVIQDEVDGLLVDNDAPAVAAAIQELREDVEFAAQLGRRARQKVKNQFSEARMIEQTLAVYRQVLSHA